jgi:hypothetical protein
MSENFEQQVKRMMEGAGLDPNPVVWQQVRNAIQPQKKKRRFIFWWILPVALVAGGVVYMVNNDNKELVARQDQANGSKSTSDNTGTQNGPIQQSQNTIHDKAGDIGSDVPAGKHAEQRGQSGIAIPKAKKSRGVHGPRDNTPKVVTRKTNSAASPVANNKKNQTGTIPDDKINIVSAISTEQATKQEAKISESLKKIIATDTMVALPGNTEKNKPTKRSKWSFGITAEAGVATVTDGGMFSFANKSLMDAVFSGPTVLPGAVPTVTYENTTVAAKKSLGIYFTIHRTIGKTISFQSSLGLRHQSFSTTTSTTKDSIITGNAVSFPVSRTSSLYRLNFIDLYTGISFSIYKVNGLKLGLGAGIDNQFLVAGMRRERDQSLLYNLVTVQSNSTSLASYNTWQPLARLQLVADMNARKNQWFQLSPYINYGLRKLERGTFSKKDHLASFGLTATYFFR